MTRTLERSPAGTAAAAAKKAADEAAAKPAGSEPEAETSEPAEEFFEFNIAQAWVGENTPLILTKVESVDE